MNPIPLPGLPHGSEILFNALYPSKEPDHLVQDLLAVKLAGGEVIDVSWHPEHDPTGRFYVTVLDRECRVELKKIEADDPHEAANGVQRLANHFAGANGLRPASTLSSFEDEWTRTA